MMEHATGAETWQELKPTDVGAVLPVKPHLFVVLEADRPSSGSARYALGDVDEVAADSQHGARPIGAAGFGVACELDECGVDRRQAGRVHAEVAGQV